MPSIRSRSGSAVWCRALRRCAQGTRFRRRSARRPSVTISDMSGAIVKWGAGCKRLTSTDCSRASSQPDAPTCASANPVSQSPPQHGAHIEKFFSRLHRGILENQSYLHIAIAAPTPIVRLKVGIWVGAYQHERIGLVYEIVIDAGDIFFERTRRLNRQSKVVPITALLSLRGCTELELTYDGVLWIGHRDYGVHALFDQLIWSLLDAQRIEQTIP